MEKFPVRQEFLNKIKKRQEERATSFKILRESNQLDESAKEILELPLRQLLGKLKLRQLSATQVLRAYTAKALEVTDKVNCVTQFVPYAAKLAAELDEKASDTTANLGPLHGLPFAVKDDQDVEGMDTTLGFAHNLEVPAKKSSVVVQVLMGHGAIPFCKTNLPQSILSFGSDNPIYGIVRNGLRPELAPGGSSSGSGSIVGAGGAPFAIGSDLGGSLRCPSHNHGLATLRGTTNRLSERGMVEGIPVITQRGVPGIIVKEASCLAMLWKLLTEDNLQNNFDPCAVPIPWNEKLFSSSLPLRIGYFQTLKLLPAFPDTQKTVFNARDALTSQGHRVVPFKMLDDREYIKPVLDHLFGGQGSWLLQKFAGEPLSVAMEDFISALRDNDGDDRGREKMFAAFSGDDMTPEEIRESVYYKRKLTMEVLKRMEESEVDLILCPAYPHPAVSLEFGHRVSGNTAYSMIWNLVDFPTGVVRFGTETEGSAERYDDFGDPYCIELKQALKNSAGMPINVQVIGKPFKEEMVLRALVELERLYKQF